VNFSLVSKISRLRFETRPPCKHVLEFRNVQNPRAASLWVNPHFREAIRLFRIINGLRLEPTVSAPIGYLVGPGRVEMANRRDTTDRRLRKTLDQICNHFSLGTPEWTAFAMAAVCGIWDPPRANIALLWDPSTHSWQGEIRFDVREGKDAVLGRWGYVRTVLERLTDREPVAFARHLRRLRKLPQPQDGKVYATGKTSRAGKLDICFYYEVVMRLERGERQVDVAAALKVDTPYLRRRQNALEAKSGGQPPFLGKWRRLAEPRSRCISDLLRSKERLVNLLRECDFDECGQIWPTCAKCEKTGICQMLGR
jgi:hypothetical protein